MMLQMYMALLGHSELRMAIELLVIYGFEIYSFIHSILTVCLAYKQLTIPVNSTMAKTH